MNLGPISHHSPIKTPTSQPADKAEKNKASSGNLGTRVVKNFTKLMGNHFKLMKEGLKLSLNVSKSLYGMVKIAVKKDTDDF